MNKIARAAGKLRIGSYLSVYDVRPIFRIVSQTNRVGLSMIIQTISFFNYNRKSFRFAFINCKENTYGSVSRNFIICLYVVLVVSCFLKLAQFFIKLDTRIFMFHFESCKDKKLNVKQKCRYIRTPLHALHKDF